MYSLPFSKIKLSNCDRNKIAKSNRIHDKILRAIGVIGATENFVIAE